MTVLVIDSANVVGSVPDGWWRDRRGATTRLRDSLPSLTLPGLGELEIVLVTEGAARGVGPIDGVRVVEAPGSGDDSIVDVVRAACSDGSAVVVATADRGLIERVEALGATVIGPRAVRR